MEKEYISFLHYTLLLPLSDTAGNLPQPCEIIKALLYKVLIRQAAEKNHKPLL